jgi:putative ABC transport system substrate-binding protein
MRRREFIGVVGGAAWSSLWPLAARAQQLTTVARVGLLIPSALDAPVTLENFGAIRQALAELGHVEGQNIVFEERGGNGTNEGLAVPAAELVSQNVDVIVAIATPAARAAHDATATIPIVVGSVGDPVQDGLVASLAHPGGNITGTTFLGPELVPKRLGLLKELLPLTTQVAVLWNPRAFSEATTKVMVSETAKAAKSLNLDLQYVEVFGPEEFERGVSEAAKMGAQAMFQFPNPTFYENRKRLVYLAAQYHLPAMYNAREFVEVGGLIGYGASPLGLNRRTAFFVDKILKGAKPADLPVEQPTVFDLAINLTTAKALGIVVPQSLLATADEVIE